MFDLSLCGHSLFKFNKVQQIHELYRKKAENARDASSVYQDIPLWGHLVVYDSPADALKSLSAEEKEDQYVRLIQIASNRQLKLMLKPGCELCRPQAALFLRVGDTCAAY